MADPDITIGELSRSLTAMERRIDQRFVALDRRFDSLQFVHRETYTVQMGTVVDRLEAIEKDRKWMIRAFVVYFLFPVLVLVAALVMGLR